METPQPKSPAAGPQHSTPSGSRRWWLRTLISGVMALTVGVLLIAALGLAQRLNLVSSTRTDTGGSGPPAANDVYTCPMHPHIRQPGSGRCSICGMALVPATSSQSDLDEFAVTIEPAQRRLANIQTSLVRRDPLAATIRTVGAIAIDESRMATVPSYVDGRIERLFADYTGVDVNTGDHLAVVYSPDLYTAQVEYIESREALARLTDSTLPVVRQTQQKLVTSSRQKLAELGMTESQITRLEDTGEPQSRLTIYSSIAGTVIEKLAVEGRYVTAGEPIYRIANLTTVWLMLELYPEDAARIRFGQRVEAEMQSLPGEVFHGRVAFIDPTVDEQTRTVGVRVEFLNEERRLRPGDYAQARIFLPLGDRGQVYDAELAGRWISPMHPQIIRDEPGDCPICGMDLVPTTRYGYSTTPIEQPASLHVPRSAVLMAGSSSVVYVETEPGRFEIRPVVLGPVLRDRVVILGGLSEGERVATAGNFLIDSQMQLAGKPSLIDPTRAVARQQNSHQPLQIAPDITVTQLPGESGRLVERLYAAYFSIHQHLAADTLPDAQTVSTMRRSATQLQDRDDVPPAARKHLLKIAADLEPLQNRPLDAFREQFKSVSRSVVLLAAQYRGEEAEEPFTHFFCPMVKGGGGDWLQNTGDVLNPYWGSQMRSCGERVHEFPLEGQPAAPP